MSPMKEVDISSLVISRGQLIAKNTQTDIEGDKENHSISSQIPNKRKTDIEADKENHSISSQIPNQRIMESYRENY